MHNLRTGDAQAGEMYYRVGQVMSYPTRDDVLQNTGVTGDELIGEKSLPRKTAHSEVAFQDNA